MTDDLILRVEQQLASVITTGSGDISERTIRQYGRTPVCREDIEALISRVRELTAQAARQNAEFDSLLLDCDKAARLNEAQAAADAKVVEAIKQLPLEHLFALVAAQDSRWDEAESALINAENVLAGLDAALAARKPSE